MIASALNSQTTSASAVKTQDRRPQGSDHRRHRYGTLHPGRAGDHPLHRSRPARLDVSRSGAAFGRAVSWCSPRTGGENPPINVGRQIPRQIGTEGQQGIRRTKMARTCAFGGAPLGRGPSNLSAVAVAGKAPAARFSGHGYPARRRRIERISGLLGAAAGHRSSWKNHCSALSIEDWRRIIGMPNDVLDHMRRPDGWRRPVTLTFILIVRSDLRASPSGDGELLP
jgi:hypothetical protein